MPHLEPGPPAPAPVGTTATRLFGAAGGDPAARLVGEFLSRLEPAPAPEPPPKVGIARRIIGTIGDALLASAAARAGGAPPAIGPVAAGLRARREAFEERSAEVAEENRKLRNRLRIGVFEAGLGKPGRQRRDLFFRGDLQWLVDDDGNRWIEIVLQDKATGGIETKIIAAPSTSRNGITEPVGTLRIASQPVTPILTPQGTALLNRTSGELQAEPPDVPLTPSEEAEPLPDQQREPKIIGTPISSDQNVEAIQAEQTLLTIAEGLLPTIDRLIQKKFVPGERTLKRVFLTTPGLADIGGREAVTTLDPDFSSFVAELKRLQSAFEEEQRGNRLTGVRLGELGGFIPRGDESFTDVRTKIRNLIEDVRRRVAIRVDLQPGITSKLPKSQAFQVPDSEFSALRRKRQAGKALTAEELERYKLALTERIKRRR